ncbi:MAG: hexose kinase [Kiritimatiellales bacterium]|nr:hexose kinase [Kiritimatiellales bacterium]
MTILPKPVICVGLSPCVQRILEFARFEPGGVNRARKVTVGIGGKGANTARMVRKLGGHPILVGYIGGANGMLLEQMLDAEEVGYRHVVVQGETRICQTLVEEGNPETTELVEEMPPLNADNWRHMMKLFESLELSGAVVPICGKLPAGAPADAYARLCGVVHEQGGRVILDTPGQPLVMALEHRPYLVKINDVELLQTLGGEDLPTACAELIKRGAQSALITRGSRTAFFVDGSQTLEIHPPPIEAVNPVGSGDAVTAGLAVALTEGREIAEALVEGMACGAANALHLISGQIEPGDVARLRCAVSVESLT